MLELGADGCFGERSKYARVVVRSLSNGSAWLEIGSGRFRGPCKEIAFWERTKDGTISVPYLKDLAWYL